MNEWNVQKNRNGSGTVYEYTANYGATSMRSRVCVTSPFGINSGLYGIEKVLEQEEKRRVSDAEKIADNHYNTWQRSTHIITK